MPTVYILSDNHDYSKAAEYGKLVFLTGGKFSRFSTSLIARILRNGLKDSSPEDFILVSSMTIMCVIACAIFALKHNRLNLLIYRMEEDHQHSYVARSLFMSDLGL